MTHELVRTLERDGILLFPSLVTPDQLAGMQRAFAARLQRLSWNDVYGYERTEMNRHMVQDVLLLDQGFLDLALHPLVTQILGEYLGPQYQLVEAKGWRTTATKKDFHGWHGDAWYDQRVVRDIPREVKLVIYLTNVTSGAFTYIKGSHQKQHPRLIPARELQGIPEAQIVRATGPAGTAVMFDTSGIHRQAVPVLEPRQAVFLNYHDPALPLQREDIEYYRYHPLVLNAAFLGNLTEEQKRILGFGDKRNYQHGFMRRRKHPFLEAVNHSLMDMTMHVNQAMVYPRKVFAKLCAVLGLG